MLFESKPVKIEAMQYLAGITGDEIVKWSEGKVEWLRESLCVKTLEGTMIANDGDWIIKGLKGEFYPCKPDVFELKYKPAGTDPDLARRLRDVDELIIASFMNLAQAVAAVREAQRTDFTPEQKAAAIDRAKQEIGCCAAHFDGIFDVL